MMPMSAQSSLSHCTTTRPGMVAGSSGTTESSCALADHHAAGVLAEVARQILRHAGTARRICGRAGCCRSKPASRNWRSVVSLGSFHSHVRTRLAELFERRDFEAQRLAHLARGGAAAIGDDVGRHGRAELAEALVDVLDGALALVAAGQVDIDIGPLAALFGEEALEQQVHADGIDGGDPERIADGAVGGRAAALRQDVVARGRSARCPRRSGSSRRAPAFR